MCEMAFSSIDSSSSIKALFCRDLFKAFSHSTSILLRSYGHFKLDGLPLVLLGVTSNLLCLKNGWNSRVKKTWRRTIKVKLAEKKPWNKKIHTNNNYYCKLWFIYLVLQCNIKKSMKTISRFHYKGCNGWTSWPHSWAKIYQYLFFPTKCSLENVIMILHSKQANWNALQHSIKPWILLLLC